jgi:peptide/nickel transport system permease protein
MSTSKIPEALFEPDVLRFRRTASVTRAVLASWGGRVGLAVVVLLCLVAFVGPFFAPFSPTAIVGAPFGAPTDDHLLGTDYLGRDVTSRFLHGGRVLIGVAFSATLLAYAVGLVIGMTAGLRRGGFDLVTVAVADLLLSFPAIVFVLMLLAATGPRLSVAIFGIAAVHIPRIVRLVRAVTIDITTSEFVEAAVARGERPWSVLWREIFPNTWTPLLADFGLRLATSIILFSSLAYLGVGQTAPAADWGLMISENRVGITIQPWIVFVPAVAIALLVIGVNLLTDALARTMGRTVSVRGA